MRAVLLFLSAPILVAVLAPFAISREIAPYPPIVLIGTIPVVLFFSALIAAPLFFTVPKNLRVSFVHMAGVAFASGFLSLFLFSIAFKGAFEQIGAVVLVQDGSLTAAGWRNLISQCLAMGALSLPAGILVCFGERVDRRVQ